MKNIPSIKVSTKELEEFYENEPSIVGGEGLILHGRRKDTLYKIFIDKKHPKICGMSQNKIQKISLLYSLNLAHTVKPVNLIILNGEIIGYELTYDKDMIPLEEADIDRKEKIRVLKATRDVLQDFGKKGIIYSDIKSNNILFNTQSRQIAFCDMDNIGIGQFPNDLKNRVYNHFLRQYGRTDEKSNAYMHNLFTLEFLGFPYNYTTYEGILETLNQKIFPPFFEEEALKTFESMTSPKTFTGEYVIKYIKK